MRRRQGEVSRWWGCGLAVAACCLSACGKVTVKVGELEETGARYRTPCEKSVEEEVKNCDKNMECCSGNCFAGEHCFASSTGQPCSDFRYCTSGYCRHDGKCGEPSISCKHPGQTCNALVNDCCGEADCVAGRCNLTNCRRDGIACSDAAECCSAQCIAGTCGDCTPDGASCGTPSGEDCCSGACTAEGTCGDPCKAWGRPCEADSECCPGFFCFNDTAGGKRCGTNLRCSADGFECTMNSQCCHYDCNGGLCRERCLKFGEACQSSKDCCAGPCVDGKCQLCRPQGGSCTFNQDCCSGTCSGTICTDCRGRGQQCANDSDCCNGLSCSHQFCDSCLSNRESCRQDSDCCSGRCVANLCVVAL